MSEPTFASHAAYRYATPESMEEPYETTRPSDAAECEPSVKRDQPGEQLGEDLELELYARDYSVRWKGQQPYSHDQLVKAAEIDGKQYFLEMPAELRNEIYRMALPTRTVRWFDRSSPLKNDHIDFDEPALLKVNRQIRDEAWSIYYMENKFIFHMWCLDASTLVK